jgi:hypothetical protein
LPEENYQKISARTAGVQVEIRTQYLPNEKLGRHRYADPLDCMLRKKAEKEHGSE